MTFKDCRWLVMFGFYQLIFEGSYVLDTFMLKSMETWNNYLISWVIHWRGESEQDRHSTLCLYQDFKKQPMLWCSKTWYYSPVWDINISQLLESTAEYRFWFLRTTIAFSIIRLTAAIEIYFKHVTSWGSGMILIHFQEAVAIATDLHHYSVRWHCDQDLFLPVFEWHSKDPDLFPHILICASAAVLKLLLRSYFVNQITNLACSIKLKNFYDESTYYLLKYTVEFISVNK